MASVWRPRPTSSTTTTVPPWINRKLFSGYNKLPNLLQTRLSTYLLFIKIFNVSWKSHPIECETFKMSKSTCISVLTNTKYLMRPLHSMKWLIFFIVGYIFFEYKQSTQAQYQCVPCVNLYFLKSNLQLAQWSVLPPHCNSLSFVFPLTLKRHPLYISVYWVRHLETSTCEGHLIGDPVNGQHSISPLITGLDEELLRCSVPVRRAETHSGDDQSQLGKRKHSRGTHIVSMTGDAYGWLNVRDSLTHYGKLKQLFLYSTPTHTHLL